MFESIRQFFDKKSAFPTSRAELDLVGSELDSALDTYANLLDAGCRDTMILEISRERIEDLRTQYHVLKLKQIIQC